MRMTRQQFDHAVDQVLGGSAVDDELEMERQVRIITAALYVIKQRRGIPDDVDFVAPPEPELRAMMRQFFAGLSSNQRKRLKRIAESLDPQKERLH
jgi:hypothetical protein